MQRTPYYHSGDSGYPNNFIPPYETAHKKSNEMRRSIIKIPTTSRIVIDGNLYLPLGGYTALIFIDMPHLVGRSNNQYAGPMTSQK